MSSAVSPQSGKTPRYRELLEELRRQIESGALPPGSQLPTFVELREREGVSRGTVEQAYLRLEQEGLIRREQGRGTFVTPRTKIQHRQIGFIGTGFALRNRFAHAANLVEGIESVLHREQLDMLLLRDDSTYGFDKVDGILVASGRPEYILTALAARLPADVPCVSLLTPITGMPAVLADDYGGGKIAARELVARNHRRISCLLQHSEPHGRTRLGGLTDALRQDGYPTDTTWYHDPMTRFPAGGYREWGLVSMRNWLQNGWRDLRCTAVFVQNDLAAMGVMDAFREAGIQVPHEVSVVGFDGSELCDYYSPSIASIEVPHTRIGSEAMELLLKQIETGNRDGASIVLPTAFRAGDSVGLALV